MLPDYYAGTVPGRDAGCRSFATWLLQGVIWRCTGIMAIPGPAARFFARIRPFEKRAELPLRNGLLAQLVEQWTLNPTVASSNLARPTKNAKGMASAIPFLFVGLRTSQAGQILRQRVNLLVGQVLDRGPHDIVGSGAIAKILELFDEVRIFLP